VFKNAASLLAKLMWCKDRWRSDREVRSNMCITTVRFSRKV